MSAQTKDSAIIQQTHALLEQIIEKMTEDYEKMMSVIKREAVETRNVLSKKIEDGRIESDSILVQLQKTVTRLEVLGDSVNTKAAAKKTRTSAASSTSPGNESTGGSTASTSTAKVALTLNGEKFPNGRSVWLKREVKKDTEFAKQFLDDAQYLEILDDVSVKDAKGATGKATKIAGLVAKTIKEDKTMDDLLKVAYDKAKEEFNKAAQEAAANNEGGDDTLKTEPKSP
jgi:hypothetical protein